MGVPPLIFRHINCTAGGTRNSFDEKKVVGCMVKQVLIVDTKSLSKAYLLKKNGFHLTKIYIP
jgi:hypothetical protein